MTLNISAPAKVNLTLHVLRRREDGYHELSTRMQKVDLCDRLELDVISSSGIEFSCSSENVPSDSTNLAVRAGQSYLDGCERTAGKGLRIHLEKKIPVGAGLGGGSSDAAAVLNGANRLFGEPLSMNDLLEMGKGLGADVPFFISGHAAAVATGIGDRLKEAASTDNVYYLLVNPGFVVSTKWVYENYRLTNKSKNFRLCGSENVEGGLFDVNRLHNDLEQVTLSRYPVLDEIKDFLTGTGAIGTLMSGSGPTVFGLFTEREGVAAARERLIEQYGKRNFRIFSVDAVGGA